MPRRAVEKKETKMTNWTELRKFLKELPLNACWNC